MLLQAAPRAMKAPPEMAGPRLAVTTGPTALFQPELENGAQWDDPMAIPPLSHKKL